MIVFEIIFRCDSLSKWPVFKATHFRSDLFSKLRILRKDPFFEKTNFSKRPIFRKDQFFEVTHFRSGRFRSYSFFEVNYFWDDRFKSDPFQEETHFRSHRFRSVKCSEATFRSDPLFGCFVLFITDALFSLHSKMSISKLLPKRVMMFEFIFSKWI